MFNPSTFGLDSSVVVSELLTNSYDSIDTLSFAKTTGTSIIAARNKNSIFFIYTTTIL